MRAFIAIDVSAEVRGELAAAQETLRRTGAKVKWVAPENIHLTLKFLGEIGEQAVEDVKAAMASVAGGGPFGFRVSGAGTFPPRGRPRVVWAGVAEGADAASKLQAALDDALHPIGFPKERQFVPHLTLGRVRAPKGSDELTAAIERLAGTTFGSCTAVEIVLYESTLTPQGAIYTAAARQTL